EILKKYQWPGNIRELKNLIERLVIMSPGSLIQAKDIPPPFNRLSDMKESFDSALMFDSIKEAREKFERAFIETKLLEFNGNISQTAEAIGIERSNLHRKIKAYGLEGFR
ncbi:MAG: sigma-54-dependent Fis family transcriptional regulator, partial [Deltaproteobacteria bacterium]|nr:sigma-54-dependent Fis family transcriptional regulator [Deltaproteobacteria bacterium]